ncbi:MAG: FadR family transcriptional regulator [Hyphomicrobiales bacterium]|nr:FadR family transcriptional regulator [Hyphomicrobiales bacterium]
MQDSSGLNLSKTQVAARHLRELKTRSRDQEVLDALIGMIEVAGLGVGDRLPPEQELARRLNVGRSTIREAMKAWQSMGIVVRNKGAGTMLAAEISSNSIHVPLTLKLEAESLLRTQGVRRPLEIEATRLATFNASDTDRRLILARSNELMSVYEAGEDWRAVDRRFHDAICDASGNPLFGQLIRQIQSAFDSIYEAPFGRPHLGAATIPIHPDLADAVVTGRVEDAVRLIETIMDTLTEDVEAVVCG